MILAPDSAITLVRGITISIVSGTVAKLFSDTVEIRAAAFRFAPAFVIVFSVVRHGVFVGSRVDVEAAAGGVDGVDVAGGSGRGGSAGGDVTVGHVGCVDFSSALVSDLSTGSGVSAGVATEFVVHGPGVVFEEAPGTFVVTIRVSAKVVTLSFRVIRFRNKLGVNPVRSTALVPSLTLPSLTSQIRSPTVQISPILLTNIV